MRFNEGDVREAYRRGARDCYEAVANGLNAKLARQVEAWLRDLESWDDPWAGDDPPPPPLA